MNIVSKGKHLVVCFDHEHGLANSGTQFIRAHLRIIDGEHRNYSLVHDLWLTEEAVEGTLRQLLCLGWDGTSLSRPSGLGSKHAVADVEHEWSDERQRFYPRVTWVNKLGSARLKEERQLPTDGIAALDRKFGDLLRSEAKPPSPTPTNNSLPPVAPPARDFSRSDDNDIPF